MAIPYAEVIGDPVSHSKSPLIHRFWLEKLGIEADYRTRTVRPEELPAYLSERRSDSWWRGCNVTAPLKQRAAELVATQAVCGLVGAVNCIVRTPLSCLVGANFDLNGIDEGLAGVDLKSSNVCLIGSGGAARAALYYLVSQQAKGITVLARDPAKAEPLVRLANGGSVAIEPMSNNAEAVSSSDIVINATPLGMAGVGEVDKSILRNLTPHQTVFDMVYSPIETALLRSALEIGARTVDGFTMLIGQAAPSFETFFGASPPREHDAELRELLAS